MAAESIKAPHPYFDRRPYNVVYYDQKGEKKTIRRVPPRPLHEMLPTDRVELTRSKNADFVKGDEFTIKHINPRHANTIQIVDDDGHTTFVSYDDLNLTEKIAPRGNRKDMSDPVNNRYLQWP